MRCESVGKKPKEGKHLAIGPQGVVSLICDECYEDIKYSYSIEKRYLADEIEDDEDTS